MVASSLAGGTIWTGQFRTSPLREPLRPAPLTSLVMSQSSTLDVATPSRSSLAGCAADPQRMYAVIAHTSTKKNDDTDGTIAAVWTSADGGRTWASVGGMVTSHNGAAISPVSLLDTREGGGQGATWNNCIAVSPTDPATVVIGWEIGMFVSRNGTATDGSASWNRLNNPTADSPLHFDYHALVFETRPTAPGRLYVGSDGGLISTDDLRQTYLTGYNAALTDLQFESLPKRVYYGLTSVSATVPGLLAGGLQDNGVVWAMAGAAGHWEGIVSGDGAGTAFLADGSLLTCSQGDGDGNAVHLWQWDGAQFTGDVKVHRSGPFGPERPTDPNGLQDPALAAVPPVYRIGEQTLCAVGGFGQEPNVIWGLFRNQDGSAPQWERLAELQADHALWSFASGDGTTIYAGVQQGLPGGRIRTYVHRIDLTASPSVVTQLPDPLPLVDGGDDSNDSPMITRLAVHPSGTLLACYNTGTGGQLLAFDAAASWSRLTGTGIVPQQNHIYALDVDDFGGFYIATDDSVYFSPAIGGTWSLASAGLPKRPHSCHLIFARTPDADGIGLYLSTFGRSAWQAHWPVPALPQGSQLGWGWNELIGNLADGTLFQLGPGGLQPIPGPGDPATQLATRYQELFTVLGDTADSVRLAIAAPTADIAEQLIINQVHARVDRLCQAAGVLTEAAAPGATASVVTARRVAQASQYMTQAAAALTQAVSELPTSMSGAGLTQAAAAMADHVTAMNTLTAGISRGPAG